MQICVGQCKKKKSIKGSRYFLLLKDDFSYFRTLYFIAAKSDMYNCLEDYITKNEKHCPKGIKILRTDNSMEFVNAPVSNLLKNYGIEHQRTVASTQNASAERENRTLIEAVRSMLAAKGFEKYFCTEAAYILNCTGSCTIKGKSPYEVWFGKLPNI